MNTIDELLELTLRESLGSDCELLESSFTGGGCINSSVVLKTTKGMVFAKYNTLGNCPDMLEKEAMGINLLVNNGLPVPQVLGHNADETHQILLLKYMDSAAPRHDYWESMGHHLAQLHNQEHASFGLDQDNYIGTLHQTNQPHDSWGEFFVHQRIQPMMRIAGSILDVNLIAKLTELCELILKNPLDEKPSLLHGDLWSGNYMCHEGRPVFIDPAVYFGHREVDLAMTKLFGGFPETFFLAYQEVCFLEDGWQKRLDMWNIYPLLVHVNLFGGGYISQLRSHVLASIGLF